MSRLVRIGAAILFLTVLVTRPAPVKAYGFEACRPVYFYYPWEIYECQEADCAEIYQTWDYNGYAPGLTCFVAYCYGPEPPDSPETVLAVQCF